MDIDVTVAEWLNGMGRSDAVRPVFVWAANELALVVVATLVIGMSTLAGRDLLRQRQVRFGLIEGAAVALLALGLGMAISQVIGAAWARPRPYDVISGLNLLTSPSGDPSFPSDHATAAFCLAIGVGAASAHLRNALLLEAIVLAVARVAVGLHYPTDVAAGLFVALVAVGAANEIVLASRGVLATVTSCTIGRLLPVGDPEPSSSRRRLTLLSSCLFAALLGMPIVVEAAGDPIRIQPEWLEGATLLGASLGLTAIWLALTRLASQAYPRPG